MSRYNMNKFVEQDSQLVRKRVNDVAEAYEIKDPSLTMARTKDMFDAFSRHFAIEDLLLSKFEATPDIQILVEKLLLRRRRLRTILGALLTLQIKESDFFAGIREILCDSKRYLQFLDEEFHPKIIAKISEDDRKYTVVIADSIGYHAVRAALS